MGKSDDLARRAVACKHWRWAPGMRYTLPTTSLHGRWKPGLSPHIMPDLTDPATVGALLALVREAWGDPCICTAVDNTGAGWWVDGWTAARPQVPSDLHPTEAEALVAALEAAP